MTHDKPASAALNAPLHPFTFTPDVDARTRADFDELARDPIGAALLEAHHYGMALGHAKGRARGRIEGIWICTALVAFVAVAVRVLT